MQTAITNFKINADTAHLAAETDTKTKGNAIVAMLARKWDMIGVAAVMGTSAAYAASQLMTLAR